MTLGRSRGINILFAYWNNGVPFNLALLYNLIEAFGFVFAILGWLILMITPKTKKTPT